MGYTRNTGLKIDVERRYILNTVDTILPPQARDVWRHASVGWTQSYFCYKRNLWYISVSKFHNKVQVSCGLGCFNVEDKTLCKRKNWIILREKKENWKTLAKVCPPIVDFLINTHHERDWLTQYSSPSHPPSRHCTGTTIRKRISNSLHLPYPFGVQCLWRFW